MAQTLFEKRPRRTKRGWNYGSLFLVALVTSMPRGVICGREGSNHRNDLKLPWLKKNILKSIQVSSDSPLREINASAPQRSGSWWEGGLIFRERSDNSKHYQWKKAKSNPQLSGPSHVSPLMDAENNSRVDQEVADDDVFRRLQPNPAIPILGGVIESLMSDPERLKLWSGKAIQIFLIWKLTVGICKAITEIFDHFSAETLEGGDPYSCSHSDLQRILSHLEAPHVHPPDTVPKFHLELANDLLAAGLPVRATCNENRTSIESLFQDLTRAEASILHQCLWRPPPSVRQHPGAMWDSVIGLDEVKERLLLTVASSSPNIGGSTATKNKGLVQETQEAYASLIRGKEKSSTSHHHGVLLFGEPGCGKSFLVQALAARLQWPCLVVSPSVLMRKYVGETNLQVRALFSLIQKKISPCIVVLDELDGLFRERHDSEHDASREVKTEFLQWMSGIMAPSSGADRHPPIIVGATNRPSDIDSAILRRLPQRFYIGLPCYSTRCQLLRKLLEGIPVADDFNIEYISQRLEGYTPSDIQQVLRTAARIGPIKEAIVFEQQQQKIPKGSRDSTKRAVRKLSMQDVMSALAHVHATPLTPSYRRALQKFANLNDGKDYRQDIPQGHFQGHPLGCHFANMGTVEAPYHDTATVGTPYDNQQYDTDYEESEEDSGEMFDDDDEFEL